MKLGLFGGSFDPVHLGHLLVAQAACEEFGLDRLCFIPAAQSPFKPDAKPAPAKARLQMLRLALAGQPHYEVDAQEVTRGGVSYTMDTVRDYRRRFPDARLFWLISRRPPGSRKKLSTRSANCATVTWVCTPSEIPMPTSTNAKAASAWSLLRQR